MEPRITDFYSRVISKPQHSLPFSGFPELASGQDFISASACHQPQLLLSAAHVSVNPSAGSYGGDSCVFLLPVPYWHCLVAILMHEEQRAQIDFLSNMPYEPCPKYKFISPTP